MLSPGAVAGTSKSRWPCCWPGPAWCRWTTVWSARGMLLARSGGSDAVDATVVCLAADGDEILTSDPGDLRGLAEAAGSHVDIIPVSAQACDDCSGTCAGGGALDGA